MIHTLFPARGAMRRAALSTAPNKLVMAVAIALSSPLFISLAMAADEAANKEINVVQPNVKIDAPVVPVTGNPLGVASDELVTPVSVLNGRELSLRRESTLGETLNSTPGVSSSYFGPNASRPVIRGLDGDRIRIMQNGVGILDASALSPDHAVALDPLIIEQIDVIRGPAALLYGGGAVGGVVNAIDHRIPKEPLEGVTGRGEVRFGGADDEKSGAAVVDVGNGLFAIHADAYKRDTNNLDIPGYKTSRREREQQALRGQQVNTTKDKLPNSSAESDGGALGASLTFDKGYAGLSYSTFNSNYGTVAEEAVRIDMKSNRWDFASEFHDLGPVINRIKLRLAHTDYQHQEIEDGEIGTTFKNRGVEGTLEAGHANIGKMSGVVGLQVQNSQFQALGEEAFIPRSNTNTKALYLYEELPLDFFRQDALKLTAGARIEHAKISSAGGGPDDPNLVPGMPRFGDAQSRNFNPLSYSAGALYAIDQNWALASNLAHTERSPTYNELYANGAHIATNQYEIGNANLDIERSNGIDAQVRWKAGPHSFSFGPYYTRFSNFLSLSNSANFRDEDGLINPLGDLPEANIIGVPAVFKGFESQGKFRVYDGYGNMDLNLRGDYVRATNRDTGDPLPRISPLRLGFGLDYKLDRFGSRLDVLHAFKQDRTADQELATVGYTLVNATVTYRLPSAFHLEVFAKAKNLLDQEIRDHTSFLKDISPYGSRSLLIGLRGEF